MPSGAYLQQPQQGQVKTGSQPQLSQTQRGAFVPQAGQMHSGAFLQQPLPVQMQVTLNKVIGSSKMVTQVCEISCTLL